MEDIDPKSVLCKQAAFGLCWSILALAVAVPAFLVVRVGVKGDPEGAPFAQRIFQALAMFAAIGLVFGPVISALAISKIRASHGLLYGLGPAVLGLYLIPLAALDVLLLVASSSVLSALFEGRPNLVLGLSLLVLPLALFWNARIIRGSLKRLGEPRAKPA